MRAGSAVRVKKRTMSSAAVGDSIIDWTRADINAFIIGAVRREVTERRTARSTGTDEAAFQASLGPYLTRMVKTGRYPTVARLVIDGAHLSAEETFDHNLVTILDGITGRPRP